MKKILIYQMKNMKHGLRSIILVTPQQVTFILMLSYYIYLDDDGSNKSAGQASAWSDMQPVNSPLSSVECETPTF